MQGIPYWRLSSAYFFYLAVIGGFVPYWNLYLKKELGFTPELIGRLMAVTLVARLGAPLFWGNLADRSGERLLLIRLCSLILGLLWLCVSQVQTWAVIAAMLCASSFFQNAIMGQLEAVTMAHLGNERTHYGRIRVWGSLGFIAMVSGLGVLFDTVSLSWLPVILALAAFATTFTTLFIPCGCPKQPSQQEGSLWDILRQPVVAGFLGAGLLLQVAMAPYYSFYSIFLESRNYSRTEIGWLWALGIAAEVAAFFAMPRLMPALGTRRVFFASLILSAFRLAGIAAGTASMPALAAMQLLQAASFAGIHAASMQLIAQHFGNSFMGRGQAIYSMLWGIGTSLGAYAAGHHWDQLGGVAVFFVSGLICFAGFLLALSTIRNVKPLFALYGQANESQ